MFTQAPLLLLFCTVVSAVQPLWEKGLGNNRFIQRHDAPWMVGSNFIPSNAINQLQMFQTDTYDEATIDRELGYAQNLGFNAMRVFLHNLLWEDADTFLSTLESFLSVAEKHDIGIMFVMLDSCWNAYPSLGVQPQPTPYTHNSQWVQAPGIDIVNNSTQFQELKPYIVGVIDYFKDDSRVIAWYD